MWLEGDPGAAIEGGVPQPVCRVMSDDSPVMMMVTLTLTMTSPHLVTRGQTLLQQPRPVTEAPATVHLLPAGQTAGAAIGQTWNKMYGHNVNTGVSINTDRDRK